MSEGQEKIGKYRTIGLSRCAHPFAFLRHEYDRRKIMPCAKLKDIRDGRKVVTAKFMLFRE